MVTAADLLTAIEHDPRFDRGTISRGFDYARRGLVVDVRRSDSADEVRLSGSVVGSVAYRAEVRTVTDEDGPDLLVRCSCPVGGTCKHVVALVAVAARRTRSEDWRDVLDEILDETARQTEGPPTGPATVSRVGVQVELPRPRPVSRSSRPASDRPRLSVRPVRLGSSGRWVKAGVGWGDLDGLGQGSAGPVRYDPDELELLHALKLAMLGRRTYLVHANDPLDLLGAAPTVWAALAGIAEAGIPLLCSDPAVTVRSAVRPARVELDLAGTDVSVDLAAGVVAEDHWYGAADLTTVGEPAHGVALWRGGPGRPGSELLLASLDRPMSATLRGWFDGGRPLTVQRAAVPELLEHYLPRVGRTLTVGSRDGSVRLPSAPVIRLRCEVTWQDDGQVEVALRWTYRRDGQTQQFPVDDPRAGGWRNRTAEVTLVAGLGLGPELDDLLSVGDRGPGTLAPRLRLRGVEAMRFAVTHLPVLAAAPQVDVVTNGEPPEFRELTGVPQVRFSARGEAERRNRTDWLDLEVVITIDDEVEGVVQIGLADVLAALASGQTRIMVRPGLHVDVDRPELDRLRRLVEAARGLTDQPPGGLRLNRHAHGLLADLEEIGPTAGQVAAWAEASSRLRQLAEGGTPPAPVALPGGLAATLRPYQHDGYQWLSLLRRFRLGGILADDMGLGKTVQTLAMIAAAREESAPGTAAPGTAASAPFLVVAPSSVVATWRSEAERFTPGLRVTTVTESTSRRGWPLARVLDPEAPADVVVTTYTLLRLEAAQYAAISWAGLVLDEAQTVKNSRSKTHAVLRDLEAECRFAITGTPIENNLMELWSILSLTSPGLFPHADAFRTEVAQPIEQDASAEVLRELRRRIRPVVLRRTKALVAADLPEKTEQVVEVELSPAHRKIYDLHLQRERQRILKLLDDLDEHRISILASLTRLRQLALDPALVDPDHERVGSAKIDELVDRLVELSAEGHRALVFSQFTGYLARVRARVAAAGIEAAYLDGGTRHRARVIDEWRAGSAPVFLISLRAGGVGLNLTEADYCFLLDPWWNPAVEAQAVDRTHRIGQTRSVMVYRMVSAGTIEEKVIELAARKADLYRNVLDADGQLSQTLTAKDIAALLEG